MFSVAGQPGPRLLCGEGSLRGPSSGSSCSCASLPGKLWEIASVLQTASSTADATLANRHDTRRCAVGRLVLIARSHVRSVSHRWLR